MKISELLEARDTHCSDKCCGSDVKAEDCKCPPTCKHCNCNAKNKMDEDQELSYDEINQSIQGLSSQEQAEFERMINAWMQSRPWSNDVKRLNEVISFYNRARVKTPSELLAMVSDYIAKNPGRGARVSETTSAGSVAAVAGGMGTVQKRNMYNTDGTMKNALDAGNLLGGATPSSKKKKSSKKA